MKADESVWGFDFVVVDRDGQVQGVAPCAVIGRDLDHAHAKLKMMQPKLNGLPEGCRVQGVRPHVFDFGYLFGPHGPPELRSPNWKPAGYGPAVVIEAAQAALLQDAQQRSAILHP